MPVINGVYLKDFPALPSSVADANIIPIAISGNQIAYRTTVAGIVTDARVTSKLLTGLSVTGSTILATDTILQAFGKVQNQLNGKVSSVGLTMPAAFNVANSPITSAGTLAVTAAGVASQYIRGDGALADFPTTGGGGSSVSYYLNGSVSQGTFVGNTYYEMNKTPVIGTGTDFSIGADGYIAQFITDANDPASLLIPAGNWNVEMYFSASSSGGTPSFYVEVYKYDGSTFTLLGTSSATPEGITNGTAIDIYYTSVGIPETVLTITDRLAIRIYVTHSGRTITLHTEDNHLSEIVTTFSNGLTTLNGLTKQAQYFAVGSTGTDFNISSSVDTHTFNIPSASLNNRGLITTGSQTLGGEKTFTSRLRVNVTNDICLYARGTGAGAHAVVGEATSGYGAWFYNTGTGSEVLRVESVSLTGSLATFNNTNGNVASINNDGDIRGKSFIKTGGTSSQFLKADGSVDTTTYQGAITLTTTGTSGAATFSANILNIPNYGSALSGYVPYTGATQTLALGTNNGITLTDTSTNVSISITSSSTGSGAIYVNKSGAGSGIQVANNGTGFGFYANNISTGYGIAIGNSSTGKGLYIDNAASATGDPFIYTLGGAAFVKAKIDYLGNITGVAGTFTGQLTLGSTITNGTYTYTLPSATGTLALTSALSSYLPLSGGTLTGALLGTSASFSQGISADVGSATSSIQVRNASTDAPFIGFFRGGTLRNTLQLLTDGSFKLTDASLVANAGLTMGALSGTSATFSSSVTAASFSSSKNGSASISSQIQLSSATGTVYSQNIQLGAAGSLDIYGYDGAAWNKNLTILSTGAATFSSSVTQSYSVITGAQPGGLGANKSIMDFSGGTARWFSYGADASTNGAFLLNSQRSDGSNAISFLSIASTGAATFSVASGIYTAVNITSPNTSVYYKLTPTGGDAYYLGAGVAQTDDFAIYNVTRSKNYLTILGGASGGNVGIGTTSPGAKLEIKGNSTDGWIKLSTTSGNPVITSTNNLTFNTLNSVEVLNLTGDGLAIFTYGGGFANQTTLDANTRFQGPNNSATAAKCYAWNTYSDQRIKEDILPLSYGLNEILQLKPVSYNQYDSEIIDDTLVLKETYKATIGLIAQEVNDSIPESVGVGNDTELWGLDYTKLIPVLVKAIQELKAEIDLLKGEPIVPTDNNLE